jgi:predicted nucleic acid-binding protein
MLIVDTNVISEIMRPSPSASVMEWWSQQQTEELFTTTVSMAEILYGIEILPRGKRRDSLRVQAELVFTQDFAGRIWPFDFEAASSFPIIAAERRAHGRPIAELDAQIASIARSRGATLATRNTNDFEGCGVRLVNPWLEVE